MKGEKIARTFIRGPGLVRGCLLEVRPVQGLQVDGGLFINTVILDAASSFRSQHASCTEETLSIRSIVLPIFRAVFCHLCLCLSPAQHRSIFHVCQMVVFFMYPLLFSDKTTFWKDFSFLASMRNTCKNSGAYVFRKIGSTNSGPPYYSGFQLRVCASCVKLF